MRADVRAVVRAVALLLAVFFLVAPVLGLLSGCGGSKNSWTPLDEANARDIVGGSRALEVICSRDGGDCPGAAVRPIEGAICISASSMLYRHGESDGGAGSCSR